MNIWLNSCLDIKYFGEEIVDEGRCGKEVAGRQKKAFYYS